VQRTVPEWCADVDAGTAPDEWAVPKPEFECHANTRVPDSDTHGNHLTMTLVECEAYFEHEEWSYMWKDNKCYRVKSTDRMSSSSGWRTCKLVKSANPIKGSPEEAAQKAALSNGAYAVGRKGTDECPPGSEVLDSVSKCKAAAEALGTHFNIVDKWSSSPKGCITTFGGGLYMNQRYGSRAHPDQARVCLKGTTRPAAWWACDKKVYDCGAANEMAFAPESTAETPLVVTVFAAFGFVTTLYGAFKHYTKQ